MYTNTHTHTYIYIYIYTDHYCSHVQLNRVLLLKAMYVTPYGNDFERETIAMSFFRFPGRHFQLVALPTCSLRVTLNPKP